MSALDDLADYLVEHGAPDRSAAFSILEAMAAPRYLELTSALMSEIPAELVGGIKGRAIDMLAPLLGPGEEDLPA